MVLIVDGTLVPTSDHAVAASAKNYRFSVSVPVVVDADSRLFSAIGDLRPGNRNDGTADRACGVLAAAAGAYLIAGSTYRGPDWAAFVRSGAGAAWADDCSQRLWLPH